MLYKLISLANKLDKLGLYKEADELDIVIKSAASMSPEQYKDYYGKEMSKERHQQWLESQKEKAEDVMTPISSTGQDELDREELKLLWQFGQPFRDRNEDMLKLIGNSLLKGKLRLEDAYPYFQLEDLVWSIEDGLKKKTWDLSNYDEKELKDKFAKIYEKVNKVYEEKYPDKTQF